MAKHVLMIESPDEKGLVYRITGHVYRRDLNITANGEFVEPGTGRFYMRTEVEGEVDPEDLAAGLREDLPAGAVVRVVEPRLKRIVVMVSKEAHCLGDILVRCQFGEINAELAGVVGNHERLRGLVEQAGYPFHHVPHGDRTREDHEAEVSAVLDRLEPDYIVLAKYMRILTPSMVARHRRRLTGPGLRTRSQTHRRHRPLRDGKPGRGTDHLPGRVPGDAPAFGGGNGHGRAQHRKTCA